MLNHPVVAVEGIIGAGKSTLSECLARDLNLRFVPEPVEDNPYLEKFYREPRRWALQMQMWLITRRCQGIMHALSNMETFSGLLVDRSIFGDRVFAELHRELGNISKEMWPIYDDFFTIMSTVIPVPSVIVHLDVNPQEAMGAIRKRGRDIEAEGVTLDYQKRLRLGYRKMLKSIANNSHAWSGKTTVFTFPGYMSEDATRVVARQVRSALQNTTTKP